MPQGADGEERISVIVGLGNPGSQYEATRHNAGFRVVDRLAAAYGIGFQERKFRASWGAGQIAGRKVVLVKPLTFMNRSGEAVGELLRYFSLSPSTMLVVHDDLDLPVGRIRVARGGGAGGHRGVASIIEHVGRQSFPRLKLGIGRPVHGEPVEAFVLQGPYPNERSLFEEMLERGFEAAQVILDAGVADAMNRFNRREPPANGSSEPSR